MAIKDTAMELAKHALELVLGPEMSGAARRRYYELKKLPARQRLIPMKTEARKLEILENKKFRGSVDELRKLDLTRLDTARLANLWQLCAISEEGSLVDVGTNKGGVALHLSNVWPERTVFACDTFEGLGPVARDPALDAGAAMTLWRESSAVKVLELFEARGRRAHVIEGVFPHSDADGRVRNVSFAHIDVVVYKSCIETLAYLAPRMTPSGLIVVNDCGRAHSAGNKQAVMEFLRDNRDWMGFPLYPAQALLFNRTTCRLALL
jgi:Macrocin-O-methyltransferase (TylF)